jgi:uncharacterized protein (TIGR04255 family)
MITDTDPFLGPIPAEVPLTSAPLVRVIAQLRFPPILSVEQPDFVAPFQNAIRAAYPVLRRELVHTLVVGPGGAGAPPPPQTAWRFGDPDSKLRVTLTQDFLALETTQYTNRSDFFGRLRTLATALGDHLQPGQVDRVGVRYIDRVIGPALAELPKLLRPEVCGIAGTVAGTYAAHALAETLFQVGDARVVARWGLVPENGVVDPAAMEPIAERSWLLDLDMFTAAPMPFDVDRIVGQAEGYAERLYAVFRWAVTDEFLRHYGGQP